MAGISLDNIETLQDAWTNDESQPQPILNSPRSLEACRRAGINAMTDIKKASLTSVLMDVLRIRGSPTTPQPPNPDEILSPERQRVLQLYPPSMRNIGTSEEKLMAFEKFQHLEGRRTSAIRMLQEIRKQLVAAEQFKIRKEMTASQKEPKPVVPPRARGPSFERTASPSQTTPKSSRSPPTRHRADDDTESITSVSTATTNENRKVRPTPAAARPERMPPRSTPTTTTKDESDVDIHKKPIHKATVSNFSTRSFSSSQPPAPDDVLSEPSSGDDEDDEFIHHAIEDHGVEFIHYTTSGPPGKHRARISVDQRRKKQKEREYRDAVEREKREKKKEVAQRAFERERILRQRQLHRPIQTPTGGDAQAPPLIEMHGAFHSSTSSAFNHVVGVHDAPSAFNEELRQRQEGVSSRSSISARSASLQQQNSPRLAAHDGDRELSAQKRKQVIEAAVAFRNTVAAAHRESIERHDSNESRRFPKESGRISPRRTGGYDYSSAAERARFVEQHVSSSEDRTPTSATIRARKALEFLEAANGVNEQASVSKLYI